MSSASATLQSFLAQVGRWQRGRQGTGYEKMLLLTGRFPLPFDLYLLRYRQGQGITPHTDPVPTGRHFRANLVLTRGKGGGQFTCQNPIFSSARLSIFRSDISEHAVSPVQGGTRYVLSLGWLL